MKRYAAMTPGAQFAELKGAAHLTEWDAPEAMNKAVRDFLRDVDAGKVKR